MTVTHTAHNMATTGHRTKFVWAAFVAAMTLVGGALLLSDPTPAPRIGTHRVLTNLNSPENYGTIFDTAQTVEDDRWQHIVIFDSGTVHGSIETLSRADHDDLGYHFVIGNGNGMAGGELHVGYRWNEQLPGTRITGDNATWWNDQTISICLVGNGLHHPYDKRQQQRLIGLVAGIQRRLGIPIDRVHLAREISEIDSPGPQFDAFDFRQQLITAGAPG